MDAQALKSLSSITSGQGTAQDTTFVNAKYPNIFKDKSPTELKSLADAESTKVSYGRRGTPGFSVVDAGRIAKDIGAPLSSLEIKNNNVQLKSKTMAEMTDDEVKALGTAAGDAEYKRRRGLENTTRPPSASDSKPPSEIYRDTYDNVNTTNAKLTVIEKLKLDPSNVVAQKMAESMGIDATNMTAAADLEKSLRKTLDLDVATLHRIENAGANEITASYAPTKYKGKRIQDNATGIIYVSDGNKWNPVK
jgi:hypothetical protein